MRRKNRMPASAVLGRVLTSALWLDFKALVKRGGEEKRVAYFLLWRQSQEEVVNAIR
jgi:hypothetical protein